MTTIERRFGTAKEHHSFRYTGVKGSPDGNESRAYSRIPKSQKISLPTGSEG